MKIVLASRNRGKIAELRALLSALIPDIEILSLEEAGIYGEIEENGATFEENALIKARAAAATGMVGVGDDSGLCVRALGGQPGVLSARYAGGHGDDAKHLALLLEKLQGVTDRTAEFRCCIACVFPDGSAPILCDGRVAGEILTQPRGTDGFGYDPVFYYPPDGMTFAEMTTERKNEITPRALALPKFAAALKVYTETEQSVNRSNKRL